MLRQYKGFAKEHLEIPSESSSQLNSAADYATGEPLYKHNIHNCRQVVPKAVHVLQEQRHCGLT